MSLKSRWQNWRRRRRSTEVIRDMPSRRPLREFVYLDEVSLRSLLVSQRDTIPEQVSRAISLAEEAELTGKISGGSDLVGKAEVGSRFQTSNSNSVQTSRKAVVQTLFNELREDANPNYALVVTSDPPNQVPALDALATKLDPSVGAPVTALTRGALVEVEVVLEVDPIFKLGTLISEYTSMSEEYPEMLDATAKAMLGEAAPVNKVLQRLLAGLIPIRARAINLSVIEVDGVDYVVHDEALAGLEIGTRHPLEVVGVTEHIGYWKDIRRVLFSSARVTMLCRVARNGLHDSWTPVKLADLFREAVPGLVDQLNAASRVGVAGLTTPDAKSGREDELGQALQIYRNRLEEAAGVELEPADESALLSALLSLPVDASAAAQRRAFAVVRSAVEQKAGMQVLDSDADLVARQESRRLAGLPLISGMGITKESPESQPDPGGSGDDRLLDVEVVAIYW